MLYCATASAAISCSPESQSSARRPASSTPTSRLPLTPLSNPQSNFSAKPKSAPIAASAPSASSRTQPWVTTYSCAQAAFSTKRRSRTAQCSDPIVISVPAARLAKARTWATSWKRKRSSWARDQRPTTSPISATRRSARASTSERARLPATTTASTNTKPLSATACS